MLKLKYSESISRLYFSKGKKKKPVDFKTIESLGVRIELGLKKTDDLEKDLSKETLRNSFIATSLGYINLIMLAYVYFMAIILIFSFNTGLIKNIVIAFLIRIFIGDIGKRYRQKTINGIENDGWKLENEVSIEEKKKIDDEHDEKEMAITQEKLKIETKKGSKRGLFALGFFLLCIIGVVFICWLYSA